MRISDWSSDVCSSDLMQQRYSWDGVLQRPAMEAAWQLFLERHPMMRTAFWWQDDHEPLQCVYRDRKSVVQGTSVSVRVDLGGRSIIKKNTPHTLTQNHLHPHTTTETHPQHITY